MKKNVSILSIVSLLLFLSACQSTVSSVKPGEMKHIPFTHLYAIGRDSTILILDINTGKITDEIKR
jgi:hypothetical protein